MSLPFDTKAPVPAVDPSDVRKVWELIRHSLEETRGEPAGVGICTTLLAEVCGPGANVSAVGMRALLLGVLVEQGALAPWQRGTDLDGSVFDAAAEYPIPALDRWDPNAILERLGTGPVE